MPSECISFLENLKAAHFFFSTDVLNVPSPDDLKVVSLSSEFMLTEMQAILKAAG